MLIYLYPCSIVTAVTVMNITIKLISFFCPFILIFDRLGDLAL